MSAIASLTEVLPLLVTDCSAVMAYMGQEQFLGQR